MKKMLCLVLCVLLALPLTAPAINAVKAQTQVLRVYNWEDYIGYDDGDIEVYKEAFEDYYQQKNPGKSVRVEYSTFGTNEILFNELKINPNSYDLVCPSDYMIEKMIEHDMLTKLEKDKLEVYNANVSPYIANLFETNGVPASGGTIKAWSDYAVGYMWGTMGYVFNPAQVASSDMENWSAIWNTEYKNKSTLKNSVRDTYFLALGYVYRNELNEQAKILQRAKIDLEIGVIDQNEYDNILNEYQSQLKIIFNRTDEKTVAKVKDALLLASKNIFSFELDEGKNDMATGKISINFAWSGDAVYAMDEAEKAGVELYYTVPVQGSNIWFDGWVMPKGANTELAYEFLNFISQPHIAISNMNEIGYTSVISGENDEILNDYILSEDLGYYDADGEYEIDLSYFFGKPVVVKTDTIGRQFSAQYPSTDIIERCTVMKNFSEAELSAINAMWDSVKSNPLPLWAILLIVFGGLLIVGAAVVFFVLRKKGFKSRKKATVVKKG